MRVSCRASIYFTCKKGHIVLHIPYPTLYYRSLNHPTMFLPQTVPPPHLVPHPHNTMMILPRVIPSGRAALSCASRRQGIYGFDLDFLLPFETLRPWVPPIQQVTAVRWATHKASRPANRGKDGPGKRLGAKKTDGTSPILLYFSFLNLLQP